MLEWNTLDFVKAPNAKSKRKRLVPSYPCMLREEHSLVLFYAQYEDAAPPTYRATCSFAPCGWRRGGVAFFACSTCEEIKLSRVGLTSTVQYSSYACRKATLGATRNTRRTITPRGNSVWHGICKRTIHDCFCRKAAGVILVKCAPGLGDSRARGVHTARDVHTAYVSESRFSTVHISSHGCGLRSCVISKLCFVN